MKIRRLDENNDWTEGALSIVENEKALYYDIITILRTFKGECFMDANLGLNVFNIIATKNTSYAENLIRDILEKHNDIIKINAIEMTRDNEKPHTFYIKIDVISVYGQFLIKEELNYTGGKKKNV